MSASMLAILHIHFLSNSFLQALRKGFKNPRTSNSKLRPKKIWYLSKRYKTQIHHGQEPHRILNSELQLRNQPHNTPFQIVIQFSFLKDTVILVKISQYFLIQKENISFSKGRQEACKKKEQ